MKDLEIFRSWEVKRSCDSALEILDVASLGRLPSRVMGTVSCPSPCPATLHPASHTEVHRLVHTIPFIPGICSDVISLFPGTVNVCLLSLSLFFLVYLARQLSILLILSKNHLLLSLIFSIFSFLCH